MLFDRRKLLLGGAAGLMLPSLARAQAPAAIGTFPEGVGADSVFVGLNMPLTGVFSGDGNDLRLGYELALAQINAGGEIPAGGETVEDEGEGPCPALFFEDVGHVIVRGAAVDNQWKTGDPRGCDVTAEAGGLGLARGIVVEVVEAGFADGNATRMGT